MVPSDRNGAGRQFLVGRVRYLGSLGIAHHEVVTHLRGAVLSSSDLRFTLPSLAGRRSARGRGRLRRGGQRASILGLVLMANARPPVVPAGAVERVGAQGHEHCPVRPAERRQGGGDKQLSLHVRQTTIISVYQSFRRGGRPAAHGAICAPADWPGNDPLRSQTLRRPAASASVPPG